MQSLNDQTLFNHNQFVVDVSKCEQEVVDFLHSYGITETCKIFASRKYWFPVYHYIQLSGKDKYVYTKVCGSFEGKHELKVVTLEEFKKIIIERKAKRILN